MPNTHPAMSRHKSVVEDGCGLYCIPCNYQAKDRNVLHLYQSSAHHNVFGWEVSFGSLAPKGGWIMIYKKIHYPNKTLLVKI